MAAMESYSVPIKLGDEDEEMPTAMHHLDLVGESKHQHHRQDDAFSRYSNNFLRLKSLLLLSKDVIARAPAVYSVARYFGPHLSPFIFFAFVSSAFIYSKCRRFQRSAEVVFAHLAQRVTVTVMDFRAGR
jgi:hypothetical protein